MNEETFLRTLHQKAKDLQLNPLLLLAGLEGLYVYKDTPLNQINYTHLDSLVLTVFALRVGDGLHALAEQNLSSTNSQLQLAAIEELTEMDAAAIARSGNAYLQSFAQLLNGKSPVRRYHQKALEIAALEIDNLQQRYGNDSVSTIMLALCQTDLKELLETTGFFQA